MTVGYSHLERFSTEEHFSPGPTSLPEKQLWCEVVYRAYHDFYRYTSLPEIQSYETYKLAIHAQDWIQSNDKEIYSCYWACHSGFDGKADTVHIQLQKITKPKLSFPSTALITF